MLHEVHAVDAIKKSIREVLKGQMKNEPAVVDGRTDVASPRVKSGGSEFINISGVIPAALVQKSTPARQSYEFSQEIRRAGHTALSGSPLVIIIVLCVFFPILEQVHFSKDIGPQKMAGRAIILVVSKPGRRL
jgi:hypothetical protein